MSGLPRALRLPPWQGDPRELFEVRRLGPLPAWAQVAAVAGLFTATVLLTHAEYRRAGTTFGFAGPGFNVLVAPIYEELIFRGWILGRLARRGGNGLALAVSSLLFGLLHLRLVFWLEPGALAVNMASAALLTGPLFAWVTLRTRSLWPAVVLHYVNNLTFFLRG
jgi:membrane protease YdiL (CAAX protease family)